MSKLNFKGVVRYIAKGISHYSPEILTGIGISGMVTSTALAVKATPKALDIIDEQKEQKGEELTTKEIVKATWKCYIPAATTTVVSIGCLIGASSVHAKRNALLATAYKISETAFTEYKEKVVETIGEKKEKAIKEKIHKDRLDKNPSKENGVIVTSNGNCHCYDHHSGRYFTSDIDKIKKSINEINRIMLRDGYVSLNEFYDQLGLTGTELGSRLGWNTDMGLVELDFSAQLDGDTPCIVIDYAKAPKYDFDKFF